MSKVINLDRQEMKTLYKKYTAEKIGLIRVTYDTPVSIRVNKYLKCLILKCATSLVSSAQAPQISTQK